MFNLDVKECIRRTTTWLNANSIRWIRTSYVAVILHHSSESIELSLAICVLMMKRNKQEFNESTIGQKNDQESRLKLAWWFMHASAVHSKWSCTFSKKRALNYLRKFFKSKNLSNVLLIRVGLFNYSFSANLVISIQQLGLELYCYNSPELC